MVIYSVIHLKENLANIAQNSQRDGIDVGLTSDSLSFIPRENTSVHVERGGRAPIEVARHTHKDGKYFHFWRAKPSILERIDRNHGSSHMLATWSPRVAGEINPQHYYFLVKSKTCLAFANPPTSPLKGEPPIDTS